MSSWSNPTRGFPMKQQQQTVSVSNYFQSQPYDTVYSNLLQFFYTYLYCQKNVELLFVVDPFFQNLLKEESMIKYLKEVPKGAERRYYNVVRNSGVAEKMRFEIIKRNALSVLRYQPSVEGQVTALIQKEALERVRFDIGLCITGITRASHYLNAIRNLQSQLKKNELSIFVVSENEPVYNEVKHLAESSWKFKKLDEPPSEITSLTQLHILQTIPTLILSFSSDLGKLLYISSRVELSKDTIVSVDSSEWAPY